MTVSDDTLSTEAVSSTLKPPKKRNSTTWCFRSSNLCRCVEGIVEGDQIQARLDRHGQGVGECDFQRAATPLLIVLRPRDIH